MKFTTGEQVRPFSDSYFIVDADFEHYTGEKLAASRDFMALLSNYTRYPIVKMPHGHQKLSQEWGIWPDTIAVPKHQNIPEDEAVLVPRQGRARQLMAMGEVQSG